MRKGYGDGEPLIEEEGLTREKAEETIALLLRPKEEIWTVAT